MKKKRLTVATLLGAMLLILSGCVRTDKHGHPIGWVYNYMAKTHAAPDDLAGSAHGKQLWLGNRRDRCDRPLDSFAGHDEPNEKINADAGKNGNGAAATA